MDAEGPAGWTQGADPRPLALPRGGARPQGLAEAPASAQPFLAPNPTLALSPILALSPFLALSPVLAPSPFLSPSLCSQWCCLPRVLESLELSWCRSKPTLLSCGCKTLARSLTTSDVPF